MDQPKQFMRGNYRTAVMAEDRLLIISLSLRLTIACILHEVRGRCQIGNSAELWRDLMQAACMSSGSESHGCPEEDLAV